MFSVGSSSIVYGGEIRTKTEGPISEYIIVYKDGNIELVTTSPNNKNKQAKIVDGNYLKDKNNVEYVQPNIEYVTFKTPNDPKFMFQQNLQISQFNTVTFWDRSVGGTTNVVAVLDSGVDINHPDLKDNIYKSPKEVKNGKDDDGNGYVDDLNGWNTVTNTGEMYDDNGHGTHCAGIIGATTNNSIGVAGINWNVKILPVKFMDYAGRGNTYAMVKAIDYIIKLKK
jgi:subtilisin family serine protease